MTPSYDIEAMAEKLCGLIKNEQLRKRYFEYSKYGLELFTKESILKKSNLLLKLV